MADFYEAMRAVRDARRNPPAPVAGADTLTAGPEPGLRGILTDLLARAYGGGAGGQAMGRQASGIFDWTPGVGEVLSGSEGIEAAKQGDWTGAALGALGAVPIVGKLAKPAKKAVKAGREALAEAKAAKAVAADVYDPYAPRVPARAAAPEPPAAPPASSIIPATRDDLAAVVKRPPQERSGVFDYSFKMPVRDLGVPRYAPARGVPARTTELLGRQDVFDKMIAGVERGLPVKDWYEFGPVYKTFIDEFGEEVGNQRFDQFVNAIASTSPRSDVGTNIRNATYYYGQAQPRPGQNSIPGINDLPAKPPKPYGHLAQKLHRMNVEKTVFPGGAGFDYRSNAKPLTFAANFSGDPSKVTVDTHAFRAPAMIGADPRFLERSFLNEKGAVPRNIMDEVARGETTMAEALGRGAFWQSKPKENEYAAFENFYQKMAQQLGITPAETQAAGWVGHGPMTGLESAPKSAMDFVEERVLLTARKTGRDPRDVWRDAIRGKTPLLSLGGAGLGGAALVSQQPEGDQS